MLPFWNLSKRFLLKKFIINVIYSIIILTEGLLVDAVILSIILFTNIYKGLLYVCKTTPF